MEMITSETNGASVRRHGHTPTQGVHAMYATRLMTEIYHLVQPSGQHTLCGLRISRVMSERKTSMLQLVPEMQPSVPICKHCQRIKAQDLRGE